MEGKGAKRRRVYSIEPKKVVEAKFARNYLNYLVPALMKIKETSSKAEQEQKQNKIYCDVVKHEVDMAMVFSAQGFAWSNALKSKLQQSEEGNYSSSSRPTKIYGQMAPSLLMPCSEIQGNEILVTINNNNNKSIKHKDIKEKMKEDLDGEEEESDEDEVVKNKRQLMSLRRLIPGGEEMCNDEQMVAELESYINCLQMQVNILQYLALSGTTS